MDGMRLAEMLMVISFMEDEVSNPEDLEISDMRKKVSEMAEWLDKAFSADCSEDDYCEGCASCDAGVAIRALRRIETSLKPFTRNEQNG